MNLRHILILAAKDGRDLLRDHRTLVVTFILPLLLYPLLSLFVVEIAQTASDGGHARARLAVLDAPAFIRAALRQAALTSAASAAAPGASDLSAPPSPPPSPALPATPALPAPRPPPSPAIPPSSSSRPPAWPTPAIPGALGAQDAAADSAVAIVDLPAPAAARLRRAVAAGAPDAAGDRAQRALLTTLLRQSGCAGAILIRTAADGTPGTGVAVLDDAAPGTDAVRHVIDTGLEAARRQLLEAGARAAHLPPGFLDPLPLRVWRVAPAAESVRMRLAAVIPIVLVLLASLGAFYPALDLIAGERERGTLEALLAWPVARPDIFLAKLLVTVAAAAASIVLNLLSLVITGALLGHQLAQSGADLGGATGVGLWVLLLSTCWVLPIVITVSTASLVLAGLAASAREAQTYLTPLLLVVCTLAGVGAMPGLAPSYAGDLVPITGVVLALRDSLRDPHLPWAHLLISVGSSLGVAWVMVGWAGRLMDSEAFRYPGLVRAGWGIFRRHGRPPPTGDGLEALAVYAIVVACFTLLGGAFRGLPTPLLVFLPQVVFLLLPALLHALIGGHDLRATFLLAAPAPQMLGRALLAIPFAVALSYAISQLQPPVPTHAAGNQALERVLSDLIADGPVVAVLCVAVLPAICEEMLCRGTLLTALRTSIGPRGAIVLSGFLFATLHLSPYRLLPQWGLGIVLGCLALRARSIVPGMLLHAGHNALALLLSDPRAEATATPPPLPWGEAFGLGAVAAGALTLLLAERPLAWWRRPAPPGGPERRMASLAEGPEPERTD